MQLQRFILLVLLPVMIDITTGQLINCELSFNRLIADMCQNMMMNVGEPPPTQFDFDDNDPPNRRRGGRGRGRGRGRGWGRGRNRNRNRPPPPDLQPPPPSFPQPQPQPPPFIVQRPRGGGTGQQQLPNVQSMYDCRDLLCLCPYFQGQVSLTGQCQLSNGQILSRAVRREYRQLSDADRQRYQSILLMIKSNGEYDRISRLHVSTQMTGSAHNGPAFFPWHREFIKRMEIAMRRIDPSIAIPYWDSTLDEPLPESRESSMFSSALQGASDAISGWIIDGPVAGWLDVDGQPLRRELGRTGSLFRNDQLNAFFADPNVFACPSTSATFEAQHNQVHFWIGGHMGNVPRSSSDPIFYMHHSFVDFIWEQWRNMRQNRQQRELEYPPEVPQCSIQQHFGSTPMAPFNTLINRDGLSNIYTDFLYEYAPRPSCPDCRSAYLFCSRTLNRCVAKVRIGGRCDRFERDDVCTLGAICSAGRCSMMSLQSIQQRAVRTAPDTNSCIDRNSSCIYWQQTGECQQRRNFMTINCAKSCRFC